MGYHRRVRSLLVSFLASLSLVACGDNLPDPTPDAREFSCCDLWPDVNAIAACSMPPPRSCGRMRCETVDGPVDIPICGPAN